MTQNFEFSNEKVEAERQLRGCYFTYCETLRSHFFLQTYKEFIFFLINYVEDVMKPILIEVSSNSDPDKPVEFLGIDHNPIFTLKEEPTIQEKETAAATDIVEVESPLTSSEYFCIKEEDRPKETVSASNNIAKLTNASQSYGPNSVSSSGSVENHAHNNSVSSTESERAVENSKIKSEEMDSDMEIVGTVVKEIKSDLDYVIRPVISSNTSSLLSDSSFSENAIERSPNKSVAESDSCCESNMSLQEPKESPDQSMCESVASDVSALSMKEPKNSPDKSVSDTQREENVRMNDLGESLENSAPQFVPNSASNLSLNEEHCRAETSVSQSDAISAVNLHLDEGNDSTEKSVSQSDANHASNLSLNEEMCSSGKPVSLSEVNSELNLRLNEENCSTKTFVVQPDSNFPSEYVQLSPEKSVNQSDTNSESNFCVKENVSSPEKAVCESVADNESTLCVNDDSGSEKPVLKASAVCESNFNVKESSSDKSISQFDNDNLISSLPNVVESSMALATENETVEATKEEASKCVFGNLFMNLASFTADITSSNSVIESSGQDPIETLECKLVTRPLSVVVDRLKPPGKSTKYCVCEECGRLFRYKNHLIFHKGTHMKEKPFACHLCPRRYSARQGLSMHVRRDHEQVVRRMYCDQSNCNYFAFSQLRLERHKQSVHKVIFDHLPLFACNYCDEKFVYKNTRNIHERVVHTKERPFSCTLCGEKFFDNSVLRRHRMRMHSTKHRLHCMYCSKRFFGTCDLRRHLDMHTGTRPYECSICSKSFVQKAHLRKHLRGVHNAER